MVSAGVDENGTPLLQARNKRKRKQSIVGAAVCRAAFLGHEQAVELLLDFGADVHVDNNEPLRRASGKGQVAVVQLLIQRGAHDYDMALGEASLYGHADLVQLLIEHGANVHALDDERYGMYRGMATPLLRSCSSSMAHIFTLAEMKPCGWLPRMATQTSCSCSSGTALCCQLLLPTEGMLLIHDDSSSFSDDEDD